MYVHGSVMGGPYLPQKKKQIEMDRMASYLLTLDLVCNGKGVNRWINRDNLKYK